MHVRSRDRLIDQLMWEVSQLKRELARLIAEDQNQKMTIESLNDRIRELENELAEFRQIAESTTNVRFTEKLY